MKGKKYKQLTQLSDICERAIRNKSAQGSFSVGELIMVADFVDCQFAFEIDSAQKVPFATTGTLRKPATLE